MLGTSKGERGANAMEHSVYTEPIQSLLETLETDPDQGLSSQEGQRRLEEYGENRLEEGKQAGLVRQVLGQLKDPMILVLLAAAALLARLILL